MRKPILLLAASTMALGLLTLTGCKNNKSDKYTKDGKLIVSARNLYFSAYRGGDSYLDEVEKKFKLHFNFASYDWANWEQQVTGSINSESVEDIFHADVDSYNFASTYKFWAEEEITKPLPDDLSAWPNIKAMIDNTSNIDALKINGKLYGIPIAKDTTNYDTSFSPFTYVYRRDWAKKWGVYKENDEYTWSEFEALLDKFKTELASSNRYALADVEWGFPSITNFYKPVPHCFAFDEVQHKYVNNYTTDAYIAGLEKSKQFMSNGWYHPDQNTAADGEMNKKYYSNQVGVLYENLSYTNYYNLRTQLRKTNASNEDFDVNDATAIMRIKNKDGKYVLEGTDNWFSMTFFDFRISDKKQQMVLDMIDWLLGEEGTTFAIYGFQGYDYDVVDGEIKIKPEAWPKDNNGQYAEKDNGAKYLRYLASLGYDTLARDPLSNQDVVSYLAAWETQMKTALAENNLKVLKENKEVMWLTTPEKALNSGNMRTVALQNVMKYVYGSNGITTIDKFKATFTSTWDKVLKEINDALGY